MAQPVTSTISVICPAAQDAYKTKIFLNLPALTSRPDNKHLEALAMNYRWSALIILLL